ncbi:MAG: hypothetical protein KGL39_48160 [Patescibacteria group bacterium]|nr:hypothetical protein [Patescibacteria group bacterium]
MTEDISDLVVRLREFVPEDPRYTVVWVENIRAFIATEAFRTFTGWRCIFRKELDNLLASTVEAADALARLSSELEAVKAEQDQWEKHATTGDEVLARTRAKLEAAEARNRKLEAALARIERWFGEFPETGKFWPNADGTPSDRPMQYSACYGSSGERDFMRAVARAALNKGAPDAQD